MPKRVDLKKSPSAGLQTRKVAKIPKIVGSSKEPNKKTPAKKSSKKNIEKILVENFVSLQRVMVNLSVNLENLSNQLSRLLNLFELSAKALAEKKENPSGVINPRLMEKIDNILEQNKIIARGVSLLHEPEFAQKTEVSSSLQQTPSPPPLSSTESKENTEGYQKSISSGPKKFSPFRKG